MKIAITILTFLFSLIPSKSFAENEIINFPRYVEHDLKERYQTGRDLRAHLLELMPVGTKLAKVEGVIKINGGDESFSFDHLDSNKGMEKNASKSEWPTFRKSVDENDGEIISITDYEKTEHNSKKKKAYLVKYRHKHSRRYSAKRWTILVQYLDGKVLDIHTRFNPKVK